jgi:agmatinase
MTLDQASREVDIALTRRGRGHAFENPFGGATSFLRRPYTKDLAGVDVAVTGVPFDMATTHRPGTRFGPRAIREASTLQTYEPPYGWPVDPMTECQVVDYGDCPFDYADIPAFPEALRRHCATILASGAACLALGGDHYVSLPLLRAHAEVHGPLALVQFDAHSDTWEEGGEARIDHGTMFARAVREGLIDTERSVQVGIRTTNDDRRGIAWIDAPTVHEIGPRETARRIVERVGDAKTYLTFDIDCLDPAFAPGTGTPVWGGLSSAQATAILHGLTGLHVVGMDVVEVSPPYDPTGATAIAGAHAATELLCVWAAGRRTAV